MSFSNGKRVNWSKEKLYSYILWSKKAIQCKLDATLRDNADMIV